jgi:PAS domain-containing protein
MTITRTEPAVADITERWRAAVRHLWPVPAEFRDAQLNRVAALDMLRCGDDVLDVLVTEGLPAVVRDGTQYFDRFDLFNLALASGTLTSVPERAIRFALRWMSGGPDTWTAPLHWSFDIELGCPHAEGCDQAATWSHAELLPQAAFGTLDDLVTTPAAQVEGGRLWFAGPGPVRLRGELTTRGRLDTLHSPRLRAIVADFLAEQYAWVRIPELLQRDDERVMAAGVAPCISASLFLEREFRRAGYEAGTRRGWLLGMLDLAHSWIEVVDDDGVMKVVDPIFARLAEYADRPHPGLANAVIGSTVNRILPATIPADGDMVTHSCRAEQRPPVRHTVIRRITR